MSGKQLLMLVLVTSVTFLGILGAGGYLYYTSPETLGLPKRVVPGDTVKQPSPIELEAQRLRNQNDSLAKKMQTFTDSLSKEKVRTDSLKNVAQSLSSQVTSQEKQQKAAQQKAEKDTLRLKNMQAFAEMYDKADPEEVAKILAKAETHYAVDILKMMKRKSAAKVIEKLPTDKAVAVAQSIAKE